MSNVLLRIVEISVQKFLKAVIVANDWAAAKNVFRVSFVWRDTICYITIDDENIIFPIFCKILSAGNELREMILSTRIILSKKYSIEL